tara:strand:- start:8982 stop:9179 length:198 start_codon:yes stop_codon:yes gene_type:complete
MKQPNPYLMTFGALGTILPMYAYIFELINAPESMLIAIPCMLIFLTSIAIADRHDAGRNGQRYQG